MRKLALGSWSSAIAGTTRHIARTMLESDVMILEICITITISIRIKTLSQLQQRRENEQVQGWGSAFLRTTANFSRCVPGLRITARHHHQARILLRCWELLYISGNLELLLFRQIFGESISTDISRLLCFGNGLLFALFIFIGSGF